MKNTNTEFDFKPVYSEPSPEFFEFKPVVNDVFRALIAARKPKSTPSTQASVDDPENTTTDEGVQPRDNIQATVENVNYVPQAEVIYAMKML